MWKNMKEKNKQIKIFTTLFTLLFLFWSFSFFFFVNEANYKKITEIKENTVKHPENLPEPELALTTSFGFKNIRANIFRLQAIQYIGWNAIHSEYKKYLFSVLDLITELNPFFESPYTLGQLLLPSYSDRYENLTEDEQKRNIREAENIGIKWIKNFCDLERVEKIKWEFDLQKIWTNKDFINPCKTYKIPFYLAFNYYFYQNNPLFASEYYKVASVNEDTPEGSKVLAAIMQGKSGDREKAIFMFLTMASSTETENELCQSFAEEIKDISTWIFTGQIPLTGQFIKELEKARIEIFWEFSEEIEDDFLDDTKCGNYVNKAIRELNLFYIEQANEQFKKDYNGSSARHAKALYDEWYINFLPSDFQQYENYSIIYMYNPKTKKYDYEMGNYD